MRTARTRVFESAASAEVHVPKEIIDRRIQGISTGMKKIEVIHYKRERRTITTGKIKKEGRYDKRDAASLKFRDSVTRDDKRNAGSVYVCQCIHVYTYVYICIEREIHLYIYV